MRRGDSLHPIRFIANALHGGTGSSRAIPADPPRYCCRSTLEKLTLDAAELGRIGGKAVKTIGGVRGLSGPVPAGY